MNRELPVHGSLLGIVKLCDKFEICRLVAMYIRKSIVEANALLEA